MAPWARITIPGLNFNFIDIYTQGFRCYLSLGCFCPLAVAADAATQSRTSINVDPNDSRNIALLLDTAAMRSCRHTNAPSLWPFDNMGFCPAFPFAFPIKRFGPLDQAIMEGFTGEEIWSRPLIPQIRWDLFDRIFLGYFSKRYYVPPYDSLTEYLENIILRQDTIMLDITEIYPWPATYEEFSRKFVEFDEPENIVDLQLPEIKVPPFTHPGHIGITIPGPITFLYNLFSRSAKRQRQYAALIEYDRIQRKLALRYNKEIIYRITGLTDEKEIYDFMQYCNFTDEFIFNSLEYEIYLAIRNCYLNYVNSN